jgi:energy-coupling factor transport system substrate-specific component
VIVTRPRAQARPLVERLEAAGHEVVECPLIEIERTSDDPVDCAGYDWLIVTSPNGADEIARRGRNLPKIAAVGPGTAEALRAHGIEPAFVPRVSSQDGLLAEFPRPAGRVLFAAVPGVQPVTVIAVAAGVALGLRAGVLVGGVAALVSNLFLGQGPWTPWQMLAWGGCGAAGALAAPLLRRRIPFALACCVLGFAFSGLMDLWEWFSFYPHTWAALTVQLGRGVWFDAAHAAGNVALALVAGPELRRLLDRYSRRLHPEIVWA